MELFAALRIELFECKRIELVLKKRKNKFEWIHEELCVQEMRDKKRRAIGISWHKFLNEEALSQNTNH